ncbi:hypothetical protein NC653_024530 [Populus alba x Populus x berolinensis]|uniref:Uncharacterized protein n=1 Tax=Populus alba x Populus x berolinensis TaxID=444605 RepID=A0AAD6Q6P0_9ROSI|nr:hypothetical protein NC653_024530 [Populus alba x Populus x berolinensis]
MGESVVFTNLVTAARVTGGWCAIVVTSCMSCVVLADADLLTLGLAVTSTLTGLVWLAIRPKSISVVRATHLLSMFPSYYVSAFSAYVTTTVLEKILRWNIRCFLVSCSLIINIFRRNWEIGNHCQRAIWPTFSLYPGISELPFLPLNTQELPSRYDCFRQCGDEGIAIIGGDTIKGFTSSDQAWIALIGEKPDATLAKHAVNK